MRSPPPLFVCCWSGNYHVPHAESLNHQQGLCHVHGFLRAEHDCSTTFLELWPEKSNFNIVKLELLKANGDGVTKTAACIYFGIYSFCQAYLIWGGKCQTTIFLHICVCSTLFSYLDHLCITTVSALEDYSKITLFFSPSSLLLLSVPAIGGMRGGEWGSFIWKWICICVVVGLLPGCSHGPTWSLNVSPMPRQSHIFICHPHSASLGRRMSKLKLQCSMPSSTWKVLNWLTVFLFPNFHCWWNYKCNIFLQA